jgi:hypothetical protein
MQEALSCTVQQLEKQVQEQAEQLACSAASAASTVATLQQQLDRLSSDNAALRQELAKACELHDCALQLYSRHLTLWVPADRAPAGSAPA